MCAIFFLTELFLRALIYFAICVLRGTNIKEAILRCKIDKKKSILKTLMIHYGREIFFKDIFH